jgi:DNA polymerase-4
MTTPILHVDMDAFYASVELLRHPELRGKPVVVGAPGARGVVAAASYEARAYGVHSAMASVRAQRLCPDATFLPGDHAHYAEVSRRVMAAFRSITPLVEPLSLDEAFLDVAGSIRLFGDPPAIAHLIRQRITEGEGLTCSVGVARNKFLAKLASEAAKPKATPKGPRFGSGVHVVEPAEELAFLHPLPTRALWGVGPQTQKILDRLGLHKVGDIAAFDERALVTALGESHGRHLYRLSHGIDDRPVVPDAPVKSVSHEETFAVDVADPERLAAEAVRMAESVAGRLRANQLAGRTVTIKVRFHDFHTITRSSTVATPIDTGYDVARVAKTLLAQVDPSSGVRLLGVGVTNFATSPGVQLSLDGVGGSATDWPDRPRGAERTGWSGATGAIDAIRHRYGDDAIVPATLTGRGVKKRGDQPWGPGTNEED